jgi:hypothetical protein
VKLIESNNTGDYRQEAVKDWINHSESVSEHHPTSPRRPKTDSDFGPTSLLATHGADGDVLRSRSQSSPSQISLACWFTSSSPWAT